MLLFTKVKASEELKIILATLQKIIPNKSKWVWWNNRKILSSETSLLKFSSTLLHRLLVIIHLRNSVPPLPFCNTTLIAFPNTWA